MVGPFSIAEKLELIKKEANLARLVGNRKIAFELVFAGYESAAFLCTQGIANRR